MAKKRRYFAKKKVLKAIAKYYRVTVSRVNTLIGASNAVTLAGLENAYDLSHILTGTSTYQELGKQFTLVKLRGVLVEVSPCGMASGTGMLCLALQQAEEQNNTGVYSQPNVIPVSEVQNTRKYIKIDSSWEPTNALNTFQFLVTLKFCII